MHSVDVSSEGVEPPSWLPDFTTIAARVLPELNHESWEISILLCDSAHMQSLNHQYRDIDLPTDVLTFSQAEGEGIPGSGDRIFGDIVIAPDVVATNAAEFGVTVSQEILRVYIHALLHLAGYTHDEIDLSDPAAREHPMLSLQERFVTMLGKEREN